MKMRMKKLHLDGELSTSGYGRRFVVVSDHDRVVTITLPWVPYWVLTQIAYCTLEDEWYDERYAVKVAYRIREAFSRAGVDDPLMNLSKVGYQIDPDYLIEISNETRREIKKITKPMARRRP